jgi:hypothetical protein
VASVAGVVHDVSSHIPEIPSDEEVLELVAKAGGQILPSNLIDELVKADHTRFNSQWAVRRCFERGKIELTLDLEVRSTMQSHA